MSDTKKGCGEVGCDPAGLDFKKAEADRHAMDVAAGQWLGSGRVPDYKTHEARWRKALNDQHLAALQQREAEVTARVKRETKERIVRALRNEVGKNDSLVDHVLGEADAGNDFLLVSETLRLTADFISTLEEP